jgi:sucrose-6-phosphate hydrolase SacC (GH32 family)
LKNPVPSPVARSYVVSGVKQAQPPSLYVSAANSSLNAGITKNDYSGFLKVRQTPIPLAYRLLTSFDQRQGVVDSITLHIFVDHSIVEVYANNGQGSTVITNVRPFPMLTPTHASLFAITRL